MDFPVNGAVRRFAAGAVLLVALLSPKPSHAASSSFTIGEQSVVQVWAGNHSDVTIRAWSRPTIQLDTDDEAVQVLRRPIAFGTVENPLSVTLPLQNIKVRDPATGEVTDSTFAPEEFPYAPEFRSGVHDTVRIVTGEGSHVTVMVPATAAILDARLRGTGDLTIDGYHGSTLFASSLGGRMTLTNIASAAFAQPMHGRLLVADSSFDRLRVRANSTALVFRNDRVRQIEVTTVSGPIAWDNGTFDPGLARFESTYGAIGLGVSNGALVQARSSQGHVFNMWDRPTPLDARSENQTSATVGGGGPVVSAYSERGNVFLYDGALGTRRMIPPDWRRLNSTLRAPEPRPMPPNGYLPPAPHAVHRTIRPAAFQNYRAMRSQ